MILALETATQACSVALVAADGRVLAERLDPQGPAHTRRLLPQVHEVLMQTGVPIGDVRTVIVGLGPGSFTGLRIGVATARALAQAGDGLALGGVPTLAALALALARGPEGSTARHVVPLIDGRRREVFAARYVVVGTGDERTVEFAVGPGEAAAGQDAPRPLPGGAPDVVPSDRLADYLADCPGALVGGDGALLYADRLPPAVVPVRAVAAPTAAMAAAAWLAGVPGVVRAAAVLPIYGRTPDASRWTGRR